VRPKLAELTNPDRVIAVTEEKTIETCLSFVRDYHLLVGGSTGTVLAAVQRLAPEFSPGDTIVAISPDLGEKYLDTIYDPAWVRTVISSEGKIPWEIDEESKSWPLRRRSMSFRDQRLKV
jgi:cysteine synthase A